MSINETIPQVIARLTSELATERAAHEATREALAKEQSECNDDTHFDPTDSIRKAEAERDAALAATDSTWLRERDLRIAGAAFDHGRHVGATELVGMDDAGAVREAFLAALLSEER